MSTCQTCPSFLAELTRTIGDTLLSHTYSAAVKQSLVQCILTSSFSNAALFLLAVRNTLIINVTAVHTTRFLGACMYACAINAIVCANQIFKGSI